MSQYDLSQPESSRLLQLEEEIAEDLKAVFRIGVNLMEIRDNKLWRENFKSFEDYCNDKWSKGSNWARKMIKAVKVQDVVPIENEWQARQLVDLSDDKKVEVFNRAVDEVSDPALVTGSQLKRIKQSVLAEEVEPDIDQAMLVNHRMLAEDFDSCLNGLTRVNSIIEGISDQSVGMWLNVEEFRMDMKNMRANIRMSKPHELCPYCMGGGKMMSLEGNEEDCSACRTLGWVPKAVWDEAPEQFKSKVRGCDSEITSNEPLMD